MQRRLAWTLTILLATALCALALPASSLAGSPTASARVQASRLESQIGALNTQMEMVVERYDAAAQKRAGLTASIAANGSQLTSTRYQLTLAQQQLAKQVVAMYKAPTTDYLNVMLATRSFSELTSQLTMFDKTGQQSALTVTQIDALKAAVEQRRQTLVAQRAQVQRVVAQIARQKTQIDRLPAATPAPAAGRSGSGASTAPATTAGPGRRRLARREGGSGRRSTRRGRSRGAAAGPAKLGLRRCAARPNHRATTPPRPSTLGLWRGAARRWGYAVGHYDRRALPWRALRLGRCESGWL